jgi:uncharacterized RDD family membrane protein YckC
MSESMEDFVQRLQTYSLNDLRDIANNIDREQYHDRYNLVVSKISELEKSQSIYKNDNDSSKIKYGGFWKRFGANFIDAMICIVAILPIMLLIKYNGLFVYILMFLGLIVSPFYSVYFNTKNGATPGKQFMGLKILTVNLDKITIKEAFLRSSVDILLSFLQFIGILLAISYVSQVISNGGSSMTLLHKVQEVNSPIYQFSKSFENLWFWSEVIVLLFNKKRRALHDFIAKTVVVVEDSLPLSVVSKFTDAF